MAHFPPVKLTRELLEDAEAFRKVYEDYLNERLRAECALFAAEIAEEDAAEEHRILFGDPSKARPLGIIYAPEHAMTPEEIARFRAEWERRHEGPPDEFITVETKP